MNNNIYNICDDWGWYIDIDIENNTNIQIINKKHTIEYDDDEYYYHIKNCKKNNIDFCYNKIDKKIKKRNYKLHEICYSALITILVTAGILIYIEY